MKKHIFIIISLLTVFIFQSCKNDDQLRIPDVPVYYTIDFRLGDPQGFRYTSYKTLTITQPIKATDRIGYGGLLLINIPLGSSSGSADYAAYDLCCPYEADPRIKVIPGEPRSDQAQCKVCGSVYDIGNKVGNPVSGPSTWSLKRYKAGLYGDILYISH